MEKDTGFAPKALQAYEWTARAAGIANVSDQRLEIRD